MLRTNTETNHAGLVYLNHDTVVKIQTEFSRNVSFACQQEIQSKSRQLVEVDY